MIENERKGREKGQREKGETIRKADWPPTADLLTCYLITELSKVCQKADSVFKASRCLFKCSAFPLWQVLYLRIWVAFSRMLISHLFTLAWLEEARGNEWSLAPPSPERFTTESGEFSPEAEYQFVVMRAGTIPVGSPPP